MPVHKITHHSAMISVQIAEKKHNHCIISKLNNVSVQMLTFTLFEFKINKSGERTQPWGKPVEDKSTSDKTPFTLTLCGRSVKMSTNQLTIPWSRFCVLIR